MKKIFFVFIALLVITAVVYFFYNKEKIIVNEDEVVISEKEDIVEDYTQAIKNAEIRFGLHYDGVDKAPNKLIDMRIDQNRSDIEKERNAKLKQQFRLKDIPNDIYVDTKIKF